MTNVTSFIHGIYPRSANLAQTSRDVERKRKKLSALSIAQKADFKNLVALQQSRNFRFIEDGKLTWQDIFRPIVENTTGMEVGALTRWFDNNCFFRQPILINTTSLDAKKLDGFFQRVPGKGWKVTLPSPFTFAKLSDGKFSFEERLIQTTKIISHLCTYLEKKGVSLIQLNEPYIPYHGATKEEKKFFLASLNTIINARKTALLAIHFYFGDAAPIVAAMQKSKIDIIGIDFFKTDIAKLPKNIHSSILAGIVDGRNSLLEDEKTLSLFIKDIIRRFHPEELYLSSNSDLELLPEIVAKEKVAILSRLERYFQ